MFGQTEAKQPVRKMSSSATMDLRFRCLFCSEKVSDSTDLSSEPVNSIDLLKKISLCFQINLNLEKYLPCAVCKQCINDINSAYNFRNKCVTIHERFKDYCESINKIQINTANTELDCGTVFDDNWSETKRKINPETKVLKTDIEVNFICDLCHKILKTKKSLLKHIVSMHEKRRHAGNVTGFGLARQYHCTICPYSTRHSQTLVNHTRTHNGERPFNCECGKSFTQASSLAAHRKIHSTTTYFTCTECGKQFKHAFSLKTHMQVHNSGTHSCHICKKVLKSKRSLTSHMDRHNNIYNYKCEECWAAFVTSAELHNHKMRHVAIKNKKCHICNYATYFKKSLSDHLKR